MYAPAAFSLPKDEALALAADIGFGALVTPAPTGLLATHLPFLIETEPLRALAHAARANPQFTPLALPGSEVDALLIVQGPFAYVSPAFYPSKAVHGRVVPTWNYEAVHLKGRLRALGDPEATLALVDALTRRHEAERPEPWSVHDAPADYMETMLRGVVGLELRVEEAVGVKKLSQNRASEDRLGVRRNLAASSRPDDQRVARDMA